MLRAMASTPGLGCYPPGSTASRALPEGNLADEFEDLRNDPALLDCCIRDLREARKGAEMLRRLQEVDVSTELLSLQGNVLAPCGAQLPPLEQQGDSGGSSLQLTSDDEDDPGLFREAAASIGSGCGKSAAPRFDLWSVILQPSRFSLACLLAWVETSALFPVELQQLKDARMRQLRDAADRKVKLHQMGRGRLQEERELSLLVRIRRLRWASLATTGTEPT